MVYHWSLSDSKYPKVSRTLLSILAYLNNAVVWMVWTRPLIFKSSILFYNPLVTVPRAPITIGKIVIFMFHSLFNSLARTMYLSFFSFFFFFQFYPMVSRDSKVHNSARDRFLFFFVLFCFVFIIIKSSRLAEIRWSVRMSKSHRTLCVSFSRTNVGLCIYHLFVFICYASLRISAFTIFLHESQRKTYAILWKYL